MENRGKFSYIPEKYVQWGKYIIDRVNVENEKALVENQTLKRFLLSSLDEVIKYKKFYETRLFSSMFNGRNENIDTNKELNDFFAALTVECMKKNNISFQQSYNWIKEWFEKILKC